MLEVLDSPCYCPRLEFVDELELGQGRFRDTVGPLGAVIISAVAVGLSLAATVATLVMLVMSERRHWPHPTRLRWDGWRAIAKGPILWITVVLLVSLFIPWISGSVVGVQLPHTLFGLPWVRWIVAIPALVTIGWGVLSNCGTGRRPPTGSARRSLITCPEKTPSASWTRDPDAVALRPSSSRGRNHPPPIPMPQEVMATNHEFFRDFSVHACVGTPRPSRRAWRP